MNEIQNIRIAELMDTSGIAFGTSGARGLVRDLTDLVAYAYTAAFLRHLEISGQSAPAGDRRVLLGGDLRPSTGRILSACAQAAMDYGYSPCYCGRVPSPALALYGLEQRVPAIMVTGSHIPDDRNGIKFNTPSGEIMKSDEAAIRELTVELRSSCSPTGNLAAAPSLQSINHGARAAYQRRWLDTFPSDFLAGLRIGVYEHSAVGRDLLREIYHSLGAVTLPFGRSDAFVPVDTEAVRPEDATLARQWAAEHRPDAIVSTDGDSDRPLISDEQGNWLRGDVAGILTARFCGADTVVVPVSCNTAVEKCGWFKDVRRSRIGSPFVIAQMYAARDAGAKCVVGYEANGGFLTASPVQIGKNILTALPTRDPMIVHLALLGLAKAQNKSISALMAELPPRFTASGRIQNIPTATSRARLNELITGGKESVQTVLPQLGPLQTSDTTDGLRLTFVSGDILHIRPSGNAPELRCYSEGSSPQRAEELVSHGINYLRHWIH